jgi:hypothetical protein
MKPEIGLVLRLLGPLIQIVCLILLFQTRGKNLVLGEVAVDTLLYSGFAVGFLLVAAGLLLHRPARRPPRDRPDLRL